MLVAQRRRILESLGMEQTTKKYVLVGFEDAPVETGLPAETCEKIFVQESTDKLDLGDAIGSTHGVIFKTKAQLREAGTGADKITPGKFVIIGKRPSKEDPAGGPYFRGAVAGDGVWWTRLALDAVPPGKKSDPTTSDKPGESAPSSSPGKVQKERGATSDEMEAEDRVR